MKTLNAVDGWFALVLDVFHRARDAYARKEPVLMRVLGRTYLPLVGPWPGPYPKPGQR